MNAIVSSITHIFSCYTSATAQLELVAPRKYGNDNERDSAYRRGTYVRPVESTSLEMRRTPLNHNIGM